MHFKFRHFILVAALPLTGFGLGGCGDAITTVGAGLMANDLATYLRKPPVNITQYNYAAADYLVQQSRTYITRRDVIKAIPLTDEDEPRVFSNIGSDIPEQVGIRFSQLGYKVDLSDVLTTNDNVNYLKPAGRLTEAADFYLGGTYLRRSKGLEISLRLSDADTGQVVAVFDYTMPMSREISDLSEPDAVIIQTTR